MRATDAATRSAAGTAAAVSWPGPPSQFDGWRAEVRQAALTELSDFVAARALPELERTGIDIAPAVLTAFVDGGKCLRSTFMYLGWLCGAHPGSGDDRAALRAAAGLEMLHAFALLQDDVMDDSALRRGRPAAHVSFAGWHRDRGLSGSPDRFGCSLAILLSDLCLVWAEQMMRESGLSPEALGRAWPHYDAMRVELAVGQFADVANDAGAMPTLEAVLDVARRKSGNYTVRRPLEIGAATAGREDLLDALGGYGGLIGEAFQMRDDLIGVFGSPEVSGKPAGGDLAERKATSVVVAAQRMAEPAARREFAELMAADELSAADVAHWRTLIVATGAPAWVEQMIDERVAAALELIADIPVDPLVRHRLELMADLCTRRTT